MSWLSKIKTFFDEALWREDLRESGSLKFLGYCSLRVVIQAAYSFQRGLGDLTAAGLTMYSILALVPLLALAMWVAQMIGFDETLRDGIVRTVKSMFPTLKDDVVPGVQSAVHRVNFGALGIIGTLILIYTGYTLFSRVEQAMNKIWRRRRGRVWWRSITAFLALVVVTPLLVLCAIVMNSILSAPELIQYLRENVSWVAEAYGMGLLIVPHLLLWIAFFAIYKFLPAARVEFRAAAIAGMLAGSAWIALHEIYLDFQVGVALWEPIYAGFLALPLLVIYLQLTWTTILVGCEMSYALQHIHELRAPWRVGPAIGTS